MTLIINNEVVSKVLTMPDTIEALEKSYLGLANQETVCRPRIDIRIPTSDPTKNYQWGTMEGGSTTGYFAIRMKSDIIYETQYNSVTTQEKYCTRPGLFCGLILLTSIENAEPLALINDGVLQHMRVGADGGIGVKLMSNPDAEVIGLVGSGGMARTHMMAFTHVRKIRKVQVFSPTKANREAFAAEMRALYGIEVVVCDAPEQVYRGAHIIAGLTDSALPVLDGACLEKGQHIVNIGGSGVPDDKSLDRVDVLFAFRLGTTPGRPSRAQARRRVHRLGGPPRDDEEGRRPPQTRARSRAEPQDGDDRRSRARPEAGPHQPRADHLLGARQPAGRPVLGRRRARLRARQGAGPRPRDPDRVAAAGHPRLTGVRPHILPWRGASPSMSIRGLARVGPRGSHLASCRRSVLSACRAKPDSLERRVGRLPCGLAG